MLMRFYEKNEYRIQNKKGIIGDSHVGWATWLPTFLIKKASRVGKEIRFLKKSDFYAKLFESEFSEFQDFQNFLFQFSS